MDKYINKIFSFCLGVSGFYIIYRAYTTYQEKSVYIATNAYTQMQSYWSPYYIAFFGCFCLVMAYYIWKLKW